MYVIYIYNEYKGPRINPWGTPYVIVQVAKRILFIDFNILLSIC